MIAREKRPHPQVNVTLMSHFEQNTIPLVITQQYTFDPTTVQTNNTRMGWHLPVGLMVLLVKKVNYPDVLTNGFDFNIFSLMFVHGSTRSVYISSIWWMMCGLLICIYLYIHYRITTQLLNAYITHTHTHYTYYLHLIYVAATKFNTLLVAIWANQYLFTNLQKYKCIQCRI